MNSKIIVRAKAPTVPWFKAFPMINRWSGLVPLSLLVILIGCAGSVANDFPSTEVIRPSGPSRETAQADETKLTRSPLVLSDVINLVIACNPTLKSAGNRWEAARARISQARTLEDPILSLGQMNEMLDNKTGMMLSQKIPWPGRLTLQGKVAEQGALMGEQGVINQRLMLIAQTKADYYDLCWVVQAIRINQEVKGILTNIEKIARLQYANGKVGQQDVLKAQIELERISNDISLMERMKETTIASLNRLLDRPTTAPLGMPAEPTLKPLKLSREQLTQQALQRNPELRTAGLEVDKNNNRVDLARKQFYPDWTIGVEYNHVNNMEVSTGRNQEWGGSIGLNLPLWQGKYRAAVREAEADKQASEQNLEALQNNTIFQIKDSYVKAANAWQVVELYRKTLIPQAGQSLAVSQSAYQTGQADFLNLLDSIRMLLDLKLNLYQAQTNYQKTLAELESLCTVLEEEITGE